MLQAGRPRHNMQAGRLHHNMQAGRLRYKLRWLMSMRWRRG